MMRLLCALMTGFWFAGLLYQLEYGDSTIKIAGAGLMLGFFVHRYIAETFDQGRPNPVF